MGKHDTWLESVPYGGYRPPGRVGLGPERAYSETEMAAILIAGLALLTGGGAALGWFLSGTRLGALVGGLAGLGYSAANLAINTAAMAAQIPQPPLTVPSDSGPVSVPGGPLPTPPEPRPISPNGLGLPTHSTAVTPTPQTPTYGANPAQPMMYGGPPVWSPPKGGANL